jgi:UDP-N-acetylmuramoyl-tripeptide--D-alanyl-D-alanine ligase
MIVIVTVILLVAIAIPAVRNYRENQLLQLEQAAYEASLEEAMKRAEELKARANAVLTDEEIISGIARYETVGRRSAVTETGKITLIDDCYNANPDSVKCGIDSLAKLPGRHVCILGDMLELGEGEEAMHRDVGAYAAQSGAALVLCSGRLGAAIAEGAGAAGKWFPSVDALIGALPELILPGDRVLVKASRGMRFDPIAEALKCL